jgi:hypothetical protein
VIALAALRVGIEVLAQPKAKGTRGNCRGSTDGSGGILRVPPEKTPTLTDLTGNKRPAAQDAGEAVH